MISTLNLYNTKEHRFIFSLYRQWYSLSSQSCPFRCGEIIEIPEQIGGITANLVFQKNSSLRLLFDSKVKVPIHYIIQKNQDSFSRELYPSSSKIDKASGRDRAARCYAKKIYDTGKHQVQVSHFIFREEHWTFCRSLSCSDDDSRSLGFEDTVFAFAIYVLGFSLIITLFVLEVLAKKLYENRRH